MTTIQQLAPDDLEPAPGTNPNVMDEETYRLLVEAIRSVGFLQPVLVRPTEEGAVHIVDGFHRVKAARELGLATIPCVVVEADDDRAAVLQIGMNKMRGALNLATVAERVGELHANGWSLDDLQLTGFSSREIDDLLAVARKADSEEDYSGATHDPDDEPAAQKPFVLELTFATSADLRRAKRGLRKAGGGKGADLAVGLLRLLDGA